MTFQGKKYLTLFITFSTSIVQKHFTTSDVLTSTSHYQSDNLRGLASVF